MDQKYDNAVKALDVDDLFLLTQRESECDQLTKLPEDFYVRVHLKIQEYHALSENAETQNERDICKDSCGSISVSLENMIDLRTSKILTYARLAAYGTVTISAKNLLPEEVPYFEEQKTLVHKHKERLYNFLNW